MASPFLSGLEKAGGVVATPFRAAERGVTQLGQGLNTALFDPKQGMIGSFPGAQAAGSFISRQGGNLLSSMEPYPKGAPGGALGTLDPRTRQGQLTYAGLLASALMEGTRSGRLGRIGGYNDAEMNQAAKELARSGEHPTVTALKNLIGGKPPPTVSGFDALVPARVGRQAGFTSPLFQQALVQHGAGKEGSTPPGFSVPNSPLVRAYLQQLGGRGNTSMFDYGANPFLAMAMSRMGHVSGNPLASLRRNVPVGVNRDEYLGLGPGGLDYQWRGGHPARINPLLSEFLATLQPYRQN